jgi:outer membrane protein OmpA-like peptidoglycan-associated protein
MRRSLWCLGLLLLVAAPALAQRPLKDFPGAKDPALFTRMPHFFLVAASSVVEKQFDSYTFLVKDAKTVERRPIEGHKVVYKYDLDRAAGAGTSSLQIMRNYQAAAATLGGKVLHEDAYRTTIVIAKEGKETWVEVAPVPAGYAYTLTIVERQAMQQAVVADAAAFKAGLAQSGHVEVPGIFFDTGKSEVRPESDAALKEVVKLLQADPALKVWVVGHTDNTGAEDMNVSLSQARSAAVVKALVGMGIAPARLAAHGAGPYAPVAENRTEEGRAKNRRVELVARQQP